MYVRILYYWHGLVLFAVTNMCVNFNQRRDATALSISQHLKAHVTTVYNDHGG